MKPVLFALLLSFSMAASAQTTYPSGVTNCIARWDFSSSGTVSSLPDVSNNNNNGTAYNLSASPGFRNGANTAMYFNGTSSYAVVTSNAMLNPSSISIVSLIKFHHFYPGYCQDNNIIYKSYDYFINGCWALEVGDVDNNCSLYSPNIEQMGFITNSFNTPALPASDYIDSNKWYLLVITYDGNTLNRYQVLMDTNTHVNNIVPISTTVLGVALGSNNYDVRIGATQNPPYPFWVNGDMDELALFNKALNATEVQSIYDYLWGGASISQPFTDTLLCGGSAFNLNYSVYNTSLFHTGNTFTAQLSDATGSFASPVTIGIATSTSSGSIACTIPAGILAGSGYRVRIVSSNPVFTIPDDQKNIKITAPVPNIVSHSPYLSTTSQYTNYQWYLNGSIISGATSGTFMPLHNGSYTVFVTDSNGCTALSANYVISNLAVQNINAPANVRIYPNPATSIIYIETVRAISVTILSMDGRVAISAGNSKQINISSLASGIYMVVVRSTEDGSIMKTEKMIKGSL